MDPLKRAKLEGIRLGLLVARHKCDHLTFKGHVDSPIYGVPSIVLDEEIKKIDAKLEVS